MASQHSAKNVNSTVTVYFAAIWWETFANALDRKGSQWTKTIPEKNVLHFWTATPPPADEALTEDCTYRNKGHVKMLIVKFDLSDREVQKYFAIGCIFSKKKKKKIFAHIFE